MMPNKKPVKDAKREPETDGRKAPAGDKEPRTAKAAGTTAKGRKKTDGRDALLKEESREFYENGLREQLSEIDEQVSELEFSMQSGDWEPDSDYERLTDDIHIQLAEAREKVDALESATDEEWGPLYREAQEAIESAGELFQKVNGVVMDLLPE
jgi:hypothetical protein